jgi:hypothetical protein
MQRLAGLILLFQRPTRAKRYPAVRFTPWKFLSDAAKEDAEILGYTERSWNKLGTNSI